MDLNEIIEERSNVIELNTHKFIAQKSNVNSDVARVAKILIREVRKFDLSYDQLKRVFIKCREACEIEVPKSDKLTILKIPTNDELQRFLNASNKNPVHRLMFDTLLGTGLRVEEFCNVEVANIDFAANTILIKNGKGGKDRIVVFGNKLKEKLQLYLAGKRNRFLFQSERNFKFSKRWIQRLIEIYSEASGTSFTAHHFRRLWYTHLSSNQINTDSRALLAGHSKKSAAALSARYNFAEVAGIKAAVIQALDNE